MMVKKRLQNLIGKAILRGQQKRQLPFFELSEVEVFASPDKRFGDYYTNVAMVIGKLEKISPREIAKIVIENLPKNTLIEKVEIAGPGFINFILSQKQLWRELAEILKKGKNYGCLNIGKNKKINIEFCSANPTGPLHLGHGRGAFWGDVLANILTKAGYQVTREYFINDYGRQVWLLGASIDARYREILGEKVELKEDYYQGDYIKELAQGIIKRDGDKYLKLSEENRIKIFSEIGVKKILDETKKLLKKVGVKFDVWFSEKMLYQPTTNNRQPTANKNQVEKAIELLKKKNTVYEKEKALWFTSSKFGDDKDRVLIRADGEPTYFASDIAYHLNKISRKYNLLINGWGADHYGYIPRLMAAAKILGFSEKLKIIIIQFVRLVEKGREVKMSKRGGTFFTLQELIDEVGKDVARFFFLMKSVDTHIDFDLTLAKEQSKKNPVYYIQYAYVRMNGILKKSQILNSKSKIESKIKNQKSKIVLLTCPAEIELIKELIRFPEIIEDISQSYQIQKLPNYTLELVTKFHSFYEKCRVISDDKNLTQARLQLILATQIVLKNCLDLMGISVPEKM